MCVYICAVYTYHIYIGVLVFGEMCGIKMTMDCGFKVICAVIQSCLAQKERAAKLHKDTFLFFYVSFFLFFLFALETLICSISIHTCTR